MANYVDNVLTATGPPDQLEALMEILRGERPVPLDETESAEGTQTRWRDWLTWGGDHPLNADSSGDTLKVRWETKWAPHWKAVEAIRQALPELSYVFSYLEEQGWGAIHTAAPNEEWTCTEEWDIPTTHADSIRYLGGCWCQPGEAVYLDCLSEQARAADLPERTKEAAVVLGRGWTGTFEELLSTAARI